jgi:predicted metal-dependent phosphotriesterase family hydrolase
MKKVRTVLGDINPSDLGTTLHHEHLITFPPMRTRTDPDYRLDDVDKITEEVRMYKEAGGSAIGEMTAGGYGRDVKKLETISKNTGIHIISTTGFIMEKLFPLEVYNLTEDQLVHLMVNDVEKGMDGTDIKAGVIKCGTSHDSMTAAERKVIRAASRAHLETGAPISTHTTDGTMAFAQIDIFDEMGVDHRKIVIGHLDRRSLQYGYIKMIASTGVYVSFDNIGKTKYYSDELRAEIVKKLIDDGFVDNILLSDDNGRKSYFKAYNGGPGLENIITDFTSRLRNHGVSQKQIETILISNPKEMFSF